MQSLSAKHKEESDTNINLQKADPILENALEANDTVTQIEELNRQTGDFAVYRYYFASIGWRRNTVLAIMGKDIWGAAPLHFRLIFERIRKTCI